MVNTAPDHAAWIQAALNRYETPLIRYAHNITGDTELARDVVQDVFLKLCKANRNKIGDRLAGWLYTVCRNRALDVLKKEKRTQPLGNGHDPGLVSRDDTESAAARNESHRLVLDALATLPVKQRAAFRLKFQDGLSYREISQVLGVSLGTVSNLVTTALTSVREQLDPELNPAPKD